MNGGRTVFVPEPPHDTLPYDLPWSAPSVRAVKIGLLLAMWLKVRRDSDAGRAGAAV